jgi:uncharacterized protein (DUF488 family)
VPLPTLCRYGMNNDAPSMDSGLFSIGHSNQPLENFVRLLTMHRIGVLVDVRSRPYSRYLPHFNARALEAAMIQAGIKYLYLGKELGGRPEESEFYDPDGYVLYSRLARSPAFLEGIRRLEQGVRQYRVAIACSEEDPSGCHRRLLIGRVLARRGIEVGHIRGDGRVQTESDLRLDRLQPGLFEEPQEQEEGVWKSIRSVSPRGQPPTSSKR